jgi:hypothetical protein
MVLRSWSGRATPVGARSYLTHFQRRVLPALRRLPGHCGALVLRRRRAGEVELHRAHALVFAGRPWLYDLAILDEHLVDRSLFRPEYAVHIPLADGSMVQMNTGTVFRILISSFS